MRAFTCVLSLCALTACATQPDTPATQPAIAAVANPYPSTYRASQSPPVLIRSATVLTGTATRLDGADVLVAEGRISAIGAGLAAPAGAQVIDASGRWVTPGLIDVHSHLGVYPSPAVQAHSDGNESTGPVTANVWAEHSVWPQDPGFAAALAALSRNPAEIFGVADRTGTLDVGRPADLVLWSGDPLEVTSLAERVFVGGHSVPMRSRQTELRDRYLERLRRGAAR